ncbi:hypothetical protein J7E85_10095 [Paenibacillus sp. ISL-20]|nr:hypothetical protein [Paenibacillus sp. ISL-20]
MAKQISVAAVSPVICGQTSSRLEGKRRADQCCCEHGTQRGEPETDRARNHPGE